LWRNPKEKGYLFAVLLMGVFSSYREKDCEAPTHKRRMLRAPGNR
jgi:uncharacterized membrane protein YiaA